MCRIISKNAFSDIGNVKLKFDYTEATSSSTQKANNKIMNFQIVSVFVITVNFEINKLPISPSNSPSLCLVSNKYFHCPWLAVYASGYKSANTSAERQA